jgi:hypothetical protein
MKTAMILASKHNYFSEERDKKDLQGSERQNAYNMLLTFFKELIGKQEEY